MSYKFYLLPIIIVIVYGCNETIVPDENFIKVNHWLQPFCINRIDFKGIYFNYDTNQFAFQFHTKCNNSIEYFRKVDSVVVIEGWETLINRNYEKKYIRKSNEYPAATHYNEIALSFNEETKLVKVEGKEIFKQ